MEVQVLMTLLERINNKGFVLNRGVPREGDLYSALSIARPVDANQEANSMREFQRVSLLDLSSINPALPITFIEFQQEGKVAVGTLFMIMPIPEDYEKRFLGRAQKGLASFHAEEALRRAKSHAIAYLFMEEVLDAPSKAIALVQFPLSDEGCPLEPILTEGDVDKNLQMHILFPCLLALSQ